MSHLCAPQRPPLTPRAGEGVRREVGAAMRSWTDRTRPVLTRLHLGCIESRWGSQGVYLKVHPLDGTDLQQCHCLRGNVTV